jgi:hypothetical protein
MKSLGELNHSQGAYHYALDLFNKALALVKQTGNEAINIYLLLLLPIHPFLSLSYCRFFFIFYYCLRCLTRFRQFITTRLGASLHSQNS